MIKTVITSMVVGNYLLKPLLCLFQTTLLRYHLYTIKFTGKYKWYLKCKCQWYLVYLQCWATISVSVIVEHFQHTKSKLVPISANLCFFYSLTPAPDKHGSVYSGHFVDTWNHTIHGLLYLV